LVSSAYAIVLLGVGAPAYFMSVEAAKAGVSVIAQDSFAKTMHMEDRVTRYLETTPSSIAEALLLVYKNEKIKGERIQNGLLFLQNINFTQSFLLFKDI
jgi:formate-dependent phosphoribosylglycinamide formyltransferase (GAR transformylase)